MNKKILDIEVLRGFAVVFVVMHHANGNLYMQIPDFMRRFYDYFGGGAGVDLFFAISGFVIARDLLPRLNAATSTGNALKISLAFWVRRAWRLLPTAWLWLLVILFLVVFFNNAGAFGTFRANFEATISGILHVANVRFAETFGAREYGVSFSYWSLSLEEQFYLIFPFLCIFFKRGLPYILAFAIVLQFFSTRSLYLLAFRTDAIALGVLLAKLTQHEFYYQIKPRFLESPSIGKLFLFVSLVCLVTLGAGALNIVSLKHGLIAIVSFILVWAASYDSNFIWKESHSRKILLWIGSRSYAIYVIHIPAFLITREVWFRLLGNQQPVGEVSFLLFTGTAISIILLFSELNYRLLEKPLRKRGNQIAKHLLSAPHAHNTSAFPAGIKTP